MSNPLSSNNKPITAAQLFAQLNAAGKTLPSGFEQLDALLPGKGWPMGRLTELLLSGPGQAELSLLLPLLRQLNQRGLQTAWIQPPEAPYWPELCRRGLRLPQQLIVDSKSHHDSFWAMEQLLRSRRCGAVIAWAAPPGAHSLRRLQLAAEHGLQQGGGGVALLLRPLNTAQQASPAALRLRLQLQPQGLWLQLLKVRAGKAGATLLIPTAELKP